ncbi:hypothetical protein BDF14DRAFT_370851 [Spinellus fusiger]|nr:hypothetical protein BDF14DRAFT_370851 [Spinellus fusiger]
MRGFRFHLSSKIKSSQAHKKSTEKNTSDKPADTKTVDFESIFWNNLLICEHRVRSSQAFYDSQEVAVVEEGQKLTRSSSKSFSRPNSILGLRKLLSYGDIRSRSSSSTPPSSIEQTSSLRRSSSRHSSELSMDISRNDEEKQDKSPKDPAISRSFPSQLLSSNGMDSSYNTYEYGSSSSANSSIVVSSKSTGFSYSKLLFLINFTGKVIKHYYISF